MSNKKKCLLVAPINFYGFSCTVIAGLEKAGYQVCLVNDEYPNNVFGRVLGKVGLLNVLRKLTIKEFRRRFSSDDYFDLVLIIKGRGVSFELINFFYTFADKIIGYNFDSLEFNPSPLDWMSNVDRYCTFDFKDAANYEIPLVHLFSSLPEDMSIPVKKYDVSVLIKNHSNRLEYIDAVLESLPCMSKFIYIFEPHILTFIFNFLKFPKLYLKYWNYIHFISLPYSDFLLILSQSRVTVDCAHPSQTGITIRCFEALSVGVPLVSNNSYIHKYEIFDKESVICYGINDNGPQLYNDVKKLTKKSFKNKRRMISQFLEELIGNDYSEINK